MKFLFQIVVITLGICIFFSSGNVSSAEGIVNTDNTTSEGKIEYGNILIVWKASADEVSANVTITMGTYLIGEMHFTPSTLKQSLDYSNPPQSATGVFIIEFNATGRGGKLFAENFVWKNKSNNGNVTSLIGTWSLDK